MGLIIKKILVKGDKGGKEMDALFDTGASLSFIQRDIVKQIATPLKMPEPMKFQLGNGRGEIEAKEMTPLHFEIKGCKINDNVLIVDSLAEGLIIGAGTLQKWRINLDLENDDIIIDKKSLELKLV